MSKPDNDDQVPAKLSDGRWITNPDEAEALGFTDHARKLRAMPPGPWRHPHPVTRVAGTVTLAVLAVLAVAVCSGLVYGVVKFLGWFL